MDLATLVVAGVAALASVAAAILTNRNRIKLQASERRFAETMSLQPRRLDLYASLVKVLRGHERSLSFKSPSALGGGTAGQKAAIRTWFLDLATDSTQRLTETGTLVGQVRLVSSAEVVGAAGRCMTKMEELNRRWMVVLLEFTKEDIERDLDAVMTGVAGAQSALMSEVEHLEAAIRTEQGITEPPKTG